MIITHLSKLEIADRMQILISSSRAARNGKQNASKNISLEKKPIASLPDWARSMNKGPFDPTYLDESYQ